MVLGLPGWLKVAVGATIVLSGVLAVLVTPDDKEDWGGD